MADLIDLDRVKEQADLLAIAGRDTVLKKVANSQGGEYAGPCPFCGGDDRFRVQPEAHRWMCHYCTGGKWQDALGYIARREKLDLHKKADLIAACEALGAGDLPTTTTRRQPPAIPAYTPPAADWQAAAGQVISECEAALWDSKYKKVLEYLRGRGLSDETIKRFRLGYCATGDPDIFGREIAGLWIPRGVLIPCIVKGEVWYLKVRLAPGVPCKCQNKHCKAILAGPGKCSSCGEDNRYRGVGGNRTAAIFNADSLAGGSAALFCEGEFDCMIATQEFSEVIPTVTLGSATNRPDLATWGAYILPLRFMLSAYDMDQAGENGGEALREIGGDRVKVCPLPEGVKDINDFQQAGGDLLGWILEAVRFWNE